MQNHLRETLVKNLRFRLRLRSFVSKACNFFGNIVNSVNHLENIKQCNFSGAPFTNPEVRPHSCDDLSTLHRFIACIKNCPCPWWMELRQQLWRTCMASNKQCFQHTGKFICRWLLCTASSGWSGQIFAKFSNKRHIPTYPNQVSKGPELHNRNARRCNGRICKFKV